MGSGRRFRAWRSLPRRERACVGAACVLTAAAALATLAAVPGAFRSLDETRAASAALSPEERDVGALYVDVDLEFLHAARRLLPEHTRYAVRTGPEVAFTQEVLEEAVYDFTRYFLLPRRQVPAEAAEWLLCYGCPGLDEERPLRIMWAKAGMAIGRYEG